MFEEYFRKYDELEQPEIEPIDMVDLKFDLNLDLDDPPYFEPLDFSDWEAKYADILNEDDSYIDSFEFNLALPQDSPMVEETSSSAVGNILNTARSQVGNKYLWANANPLSGFDCSGLIWWSFKQNGINIPRSTEAMLKSGKKVTLEEIQPGDIIITKSKGGRHARLVLSISNGKINTIEAEGKDTGVIESEFTDFDRIISIRRYWDKAPDYIESTAKRTLHFANSKDYTKKMTKVFKTVLKQKGLDADKWAPVLVAHTALESRWGQSQLSLKANNFGGIKGTGVKMNTSEYNAKGKYNTRASFKSYVSPEAFAEDYISLLQRRYHVFDYKPEQFVAALKLKGYFTAPLALYQRTFNGVLTMVNNG